MKDKVIVLPWLPLLGIAFVVLKLTEVINWSWWWVLAPFWVIPVIYLFLVMIIMLLGSQKSYSRPLTTNRNFRK